MTPHVPSISVANTVTTYPLFSAMINRRSRRFAKGAALDGGPLAFESAVAPEPLTLEEEAALAFAAAGITGCALAELPFDRGAQPGSGCGNIITHFVGRTIPSGDALHSVVLFVFNDEGTWMIRRPQELTRDELTAVVDAGREGRLVDAYERLRVRLSSHRAAVSRTVPLVAPFNLWDSNLPGTTYFLPVTEFTSLYINVLLTAFSRELGYFIVDDHAGYRAAGVDRFAQSRGGHLIDNPAGGRVIPIGFLETALASIAAAEEGAMHQNLALMAEALGVGGFTHACRHAEWLKALGFDVTLVPFSRVAGLGVGARVAMRLLGRPDPTIEIPVGLRRPGRPDQWLLKPFCPPHYPTMREAVMAFVEYKFGEADGTLTGNGPAAWEDAARVRRQIARYRPEAIEATVAYCEYVYARYGRFPMTMSPFETILAFQAHHLDIGFYDRFYRSDALSSRHRAHHHD